MALAARLILKPEVLLMDEPTASIDALSAQLIKDAVLKARRDWGTTLIVASHDWQWLYGICDTVFHLLKGRFLGTGRENVLFGPWELWRTGGGESGSPTASSCWCPSRRRPLRRLLSKMSLLCHRPSLSLARRGRSRCPA